MVLLLKLVENWWW